MDVAETPETRVKFPKFQCECGKGYEKSSNYKDHRVRCKIWLASHHDVFQQDRERCGLCLPTSEPKTYEKFRKHLSYLAELRTTSGCDGKHSFKTPAEHRMWLEGVFIMRKQGEALSSMVDFNAVAQFLRVSFFSYFSVFFFHFR